MTANVISAGTVDADVDRPAPVIATVDPSEDGSLLDDRAMGRAAVYGFVGGTLVMTALCFVFGLIAGLEPDIAIAVAPVPGLVAGLFFGMNAYIGVVHRPPRPLDESVSDSRGSRPRGRPEGARSCRPPRW